MQIRKKLSLAFLGGCCALAMNFSAFAQSSPLVKPGAPGEPARKLSVEESLELGQSRYTPDDVMFMQMMIVHHGQAVDMGALIGERSAHKGVILMGDRIARAQTNEIAMMRKWLRRRGESTDMPAGDHRHHMNAGSKMQAGHHRAPEDETDLHPDDIAVMHGMLTPRQMRELAASSAEKFDRLFLSGMIEHHQGAVDMVNGLALGSNNGEDPELSEFMASIIADQKAEIARMQQMLDALNNE